LIELPSIALYKIARNPNSLEKLLLQKPLPLELAKTDASSTAWRHHNFFAWLFNNSTNCSRILSPVFSQRPEGTTDNNPAVHCREKSAQITSAEGTAGTSRRTLNNLYHHLQIRNQITIHEANLQERATNLWQAWEAQFANQNLGTAPPSREE